MLGNHDMVDEIRYLMDQEVEHLETIDTRRSERKVRSPLLDPVWWTAGFAIGL